MDDVTDDHFKHVRDSVETTFNQAVFRSMYHGELAVETAKLARLTLRTIALIGLIGVGPLIGALLLGMIDDVRITLSILVALLAIGLLLAQASEKLTRRAKKSMAFANSFSAVANDTIQLLTNTKHNKVFIDDLPNQQYNLSAELDRQIRMANEQGFQITKRHEHGRRFKKVQHMSRSYVDANFPKP